MEEINVGTYLYMNKWGDVYQKVCVTKIYFERYINGWKTIIKVQTESGLTYSFFVGDLNHKLFIEIPEDGQLYGSTVGWCENNG